ncbi:hypothetical protein [Viridibacillus arvi]|uniref:hypothetical protein n=1 Tax=Viridibacillus arvi TaxID=263475 RepID=UPI0034CE9FDA
MIWSYKESEELTEDILITRLYEGEMIFIESDESETTLEYIETEMKEHGKNGDIQWYTYMEIMNNPNTHSLVLKSRK